MRFLCIYAVVKLQNQSKSIKESKRSISPIIHLLKQQKQQLQHKENLQKCQEKITVNCLSPIYLIFMHKFMIAWIMLLFVVSKFLAT